MQAGTSVQVQSPPRGDGYAQRAEAVAVQLLWAVVPAAGLLVVWELGTLVARRACAP